MRKFYKFNYVVMCIVATLLGYQTAWSQAEATPFSATLDTAEELARWQTYDVDGNVEGEQATWYLAHSDMGGDAAASYADAVNYTLIDNWLVSPAIHLEAGKQYVLKFKYYTAYYDKEQLATYISTSPEPEAEHTLLKKDLYNSYYGANETLLIPVQEADTDIYVSFQHTNLNDDGTEGFVIFIKTVEVGEMSEGAVSGKVTTSGYVGSDWVTSPVEGMNISITGPVTMETVSAADGTYSFEAVPEGTYTMNYSKFGFEGSDKSYYPTTITVNPNETTIKDLSVYKLGQALVKGTVTDNADQPILGASVSLKGYSDFVATTDANGEFIFDGVYMDGGSYDPSLYRLEVRKNGYEYLEREESLEKSWGSDDIALPAIKLTTKAVAPNKIFTEDAVTEDAQSIVNISWPIPVDNVEYKYDTGTPKEPKGYAVSSEMNIMGSVFRTPANISKIRWYRMSGPEWAETPPENINLYIINLDENGEPNGEMLYTKLGIPSKLDEWTEFELAETLSAPRGCLVALNALGYLSIATDDNEGLAEAHTQLYSNSYNGGYTYFDDKSVNWNGALMIRTESERIETEGSVKPEATFELYRFPEGTYNESDWTKVMESSSATEFTDNSFANLPRGTYRYAVKALYAGDNVTSKATVSGPVYKDQFTAVKVNVTADSDPQDANGAIIRLNDNAGHIYNASVINGIAEFPKVWKATYSLAAQQQGFSFKDITTDFNEEAEYELAINLQQNLQPVNNIDIEQVEDEYYLIYDLFADIYDGFESEDYTDFEINPVGKLGWTFIDNDQYRTYGFNGFEFPGMGSPMAACIMNPEACTPPNEHKYAHKGRRSLAFFAAYPDETEGGLVLHRSDDYMISPRLDFHKDFTFSFFAKTHMNIDGRLETIRVGYSKTGKDLSDFEWVSGDYEEVPEEEYTMFSYDMPREARYVALNNASDDVFILFVDDVKIGTGITTSGKEPAYGKTLGYKIYLDGVEQGTTEDTQWHLENLADGMHMAEVSKLYNMGESETLSITFNKASGVITTISDELRIKYFDRNLTINGVYTDASIYSMAGTLVRSGITGNEPVNCGELAAGVYIVRVNVENGQTINAKIIVK